MRKFFAAAVERGERSVMTHAAPSRAPCPECRAGRLQRLLDALPGGVVVLDGDGIVRDANPAATELFGEPLANERWCDVIARAFVPAPGADDEISLRDGRRLTLDIRTLDGEPGQILLFRDATRAWRLQERLARQQRLAAMGEMAANLAHQVRTPLATAMLYLSNLAAAGAEARPLAQQALASLRHIEKLVNDMLAFVRGARPQGEIVRVTELLDALHESLAPQLETHNASLECRTRTAADAAVCGNRQALLGALQNLAVNAIQAKGRGARLHLEVAGGDAGRIDFFLRDDGPGIAPELHERIFEPFFTTRAQGTGLGLAVVRSVARAHDGEAWLAASQPGQGSTFGFAVRSAQRGAGGEKNSSDPAFRAPHPALVTEAPS
jgi:two-component system sensor histidine kinase FlrB